MSPRCTPYCTGTIAVPPTGAPAPYTAPPTISGNGVHSEEQRERDRRSAGQGLLPSARHAGTDTPAPCRAEPVPGLYIYPAGEAMTDPAYCGPISHSCGVSTDLQKPLPHHLAALGGMELAAKLGPEKNTVKRTPAGILSRRGVASGAGAALASCSKAIGSLMITRDLPRKPLHQRSPIFPHWAMTNLRTKIISWSRRLWPGMQAYTDAQ